MGPHLLWRGGVNTWTSAERVEEEALREEVGIWREGALGKMNPSYLKVFSPGDKA